MGCGRGWWGLGGETFVKGGGGFTVTETTDVGLTGGWRGGGWVCKRVGWTPE